MEKNIIQLSEAYIAQLFEQELPPELLYHDIAHTTSVRQTSRILAEHYQLDDKEKEAMELAAIFHDSGYIKVYQGHEEVSQEIAVAFLKQYNYPADQIEKVKELIAATKLIYQPKNLLQEIIKDADLNNLGQSKYLQTISNLRSEMKVFLGTKYKDKDWYKTNINFIDGHTYFTDKAKELFDPKKKENRKKVKKMLDNFKAKKKKKRMHVRKR